jgi:hypothetical protein
MISEFRTLILIGGSFVRLHFSKRGFIIGLTGGWVFVLKVPYKHCSGVALGLCNTTPAAHMPIIEVMHSYY